MKVGIQGIKGSFHEVAANKFFGKEIDIIEHSGFDELIKDLIKGKTNQAVMAIENTIAGSLLGNYALLRDNDVKVIGEVYLNIQMSLLSLHDCELDAIKTVESHPIALQQCRVFFESKLPHVELRESFDTAGSAEKLSKTRETGLAVVAAETCGVLYNLKILARNIETNKQNFTRFLILQRGNASIENPNKATLSFELKHEQGSLANVLSFLSQGGLNLTKIQSVPIIGLPYQYFFYIDLEFEREEQFDTVFQELSKMTLSHKLIGKYTKASFELNQ